MTVDNEWYGLGPMSRAVLVRAGITTIEQLRHKGAVAAFVAAKAIEPRVSLNLLWGIAAALSGVHWSKLDPGFKTSLLLEYDACCDQQPSARRPNRKHRSSK